MSFSSSPMLNTLWQSYNTLEELQKDAKEAQEKNLIEKEAASSLQFNESDLEGVDKIENAFRQLLQRVYNVELSADRTQATSFIIKLHTLASYFPHHASFLLQQTIVNTQVFKAIVKNSDDFLKLALTFPNHSKNLINFLLEHPDEFKRLIKNQHDLLMILKILPNHASKILEFVLTKKSEFKRLIPQLADLELIRYAFTISYTTYWQRVYDRNSTWTDDIPNALLFEYFVTHGATIQKIYSNNLFLNYYNRLVNCLLINTSEFDRLILDDRDLSDLINCSPGHPLLEKAKKENMDLQTFKKSSLFTEWTQKNQAELFEPEIEGEEKIEEAPSIDMSLILRSVDSFKTNLLNPIISNPKAYLKSMPDAESFSVTLAHLSPEQTEKSIDLLLSDFDEWTRLINRLHDLDKIMSVIQDKAEALNIIGRSTSNRALYNSTVLVRSNCLRKLTNFLLANLSEFDRLITKDQQLKTLISLNPDHPLLKEGVNVDLKTFREQHLKPWISRYEIRVTARWLTLIASNQHTTLFQAFNKTTSSQSAISSKKSILANIAVRSSNIAGVIEETKAHEIAHDVLNEGIPERIQRRR